MVNRCGTQSGKGPCNRWGGPASCQRLRSKNLLLAILAALVVASVTLAWRQAQELAQLRAATLLGDERANLEARLDQFKRRNLALQAELAALRSSRSDPGGGTENKSRKPGDGTNAGGDSAVLNKLAALAAESGAASKRDGDLEVLAAMADLPEFQRMMALQQRGKVDEKYAALFKKLKLTPEEQSRLETLLADRQSAFTDALLAARDLGLTGKEARDMASKVANTTQKDVTASIKDLLGPQRFGQLQNYEKTAPQREMVDQLAQRLSYTPTPLSARQQDQLVQALVNPPQQKITTNAKGGQKITILPAAPTMIAPLPGTVAGLGIGSSSSVAISGAAVAQAQTFLSPQQLAALQRMQQEQQAQQTIGNLLRTGQANPPPAVKPPKPGK
jgi:hypothetical protein